jgi:hypothetical protein
VPKLTKEDAVSTSLFLATKRAEPEEDKPVCMGGKRSREAGTDRLSKPAWPTAGQAGHRDQV